LDQIRPEYSRVYRIKDSVVVSADGTKKETTTVESPPIRRDTPSFAVMNAHASCANAASNARHVLATSVVISAAALAAVNIGR